MPALLALIAVLLLHKSGALQAEGAWLAVAICAAFWAVVAAVVLLTERDEYPG